MWAPNAKRVSVVGNFNAWDGRVHPMRALRPGGYWEIFIPDLGIGDPYKFEIIGAGGLPVLKADPCGRYFERPPDTASIVWDSGGYQWQDDDWMADTPRPRAVAAPADVGLRSASRQLAALARRAACSRIARWPSGSCPT